MYNVLRRQPVAVLLKIMSPILHMSPELTALSIVVVFRMNSSCSFGENTPSFRNRSKIFENLARPTRCIGSPSNSPRTVNGKLVSSFTFCQSFSNVALRKTNQNWFKSPRTGIGSVVANPIQHATFTIQNTANVTLIVGRIVIEFSSSRSVKLQS
jgi:hypothetical protein